MCGVSVKQTVTGYGVTYVEVGETNILYINLDDDRSMVLLRLAAVDTQLFKFIEAVELANGFGWYEMPLSRPMAVSSWARVAELFYHEGLYARLHGGGLVKLANADFEFLETLASLVSKMFELNGYWCYNPQDDQLDWIELTRV